MIPLVYTVATAGLNGNVVIWDVNYDKQVKTCSIMSLHTSTCQGIDWNRSNTNLLIACFQDGRISLWVHLDWSIECRTGEQIRLRTSGPSPRERTGFRLSASIPFTTLSSRVSAKIQPSV